MKYVGLDWASQAHDVTVLDEAGQVLDRWAFPHSEAGWLMTLDRLRRQGLPDELPVIVERTSGLVVDRLLSAGHPVAPVHPTAFFAARPRWGASGRNPIRGIATSSLTTCAPTRIGCADWHRSILACRNYRCWSASAMITSARGQRHPTS
jgi:Transposase